MRLRLVSVGRDRSGLFEPGVQEYARRIRRHLPFDLVELPASRRRDPREARAEEARRLLEATRGRRRIARDERGRARTSEACAEHLGRWMQEGRDVDLVVGGDEGLDGPVREAADLVLSLSAMTLPHRLARLVAAEQIYRALTILRGEPYHK